MMYPSRCTPRHPSIIDFEYERASKDADRWTRFHWRRSRLCSQSVYIGCGHSKWMTKQLKGSSLYVVLPHPSSPPPTNCLGNCRTFSPTMSTAQAQQIRAPPEARNVAQFLRSSKAGMKIRVGALNGKRIDYFKGVPVSSPLVFSPVPPSRFQENPPSKRSFPRPTPSSKTSRP